MTLIWNIIQSVITILEIRVCVWMMEKFAEPRYSGKKQKIVVWIVTLGVGGLYAVNRWITAYYSRVIILVSLVGLSLLSIWLFRYFRKIAIFVAINYFLIGGLIDLIVMSTIEIITQISGAFVYILTINSGLRIGVMVCSKTLICLFCWIVQGKVNREVIYQVTGRKIVVIALLLCVTEYVGIHVFTEMLGVDPHVTSDLMIRQVFCIILIFLLFVIVGIAVLYYDKKDQLKQKNIFVESLNFENQRMIRLYREREMTYHDFKNHLLALDSFVQTGEFDQFASYLDQIKKPFLQKAAERKIGHGIMDLILNYKINEAETQNIQVKSCVWGYMNFCPGITDEDACSLLGNIWDNAIESCKRLNSEDVWIDFQMHIRPGKFLIEISNPCKEVSQDEYGNLRTLKAKKGIHGIGMRTVRDIAERYHGYFRYVLHDHIFTVEVMICNK